MGFFASSSHQWKRHIPLNLNFLFLKIECIAWLLGPLSSVPHLICTLASDGFTSPGLARFSCAFRVLLRTDVLIRQLRLLKSTLKQLLGFYTVVKLFVGYS